MTPIILSAPDVDIPGAPDPIVLPHFAYPFEFSAAGAHVNEQDSLDDIFACVRTIVACPVGAWSDQPSFGIPSPLFSQAPVDVNAITLSIFRREPRARLVASEYPDLMSAATRNVRIEVGAVQEDG